MVSFVSKLRETKPCWKASLASIFRPDNASSRIKLLNNCTEWQKTSDKIRNSAFTVYEFMKVATIRVLTLLCLQCFNFWYKILRTQTKIQTWDEWKSQKAAKASSSFWLPIIFGSRCNPPTSDARPMFTSANWKAASSVQKRMSQADTNSSPAPKTAPCIQAITAFPQISWCSGNGTSLISEMQEGSPFWDLQYFSHWKQELNKKKRKEMPCEPLSFDRCECILPCLSKMADLQSSSCHILSLRALPSQQKLPSWNFHFDRATESLKMVKAACRSKPAQKRRPAPQQINFCPFSQVSRLLILLMVVPLSKLSYFHKIP